MKRSTDFVLATARAVFLLSAVLTSHAAMAKHDPRNGYDQDDGRGKKMRANPEARWEEWNRLHGNPSSHYGQGYEFRHGAEENTFRPDNNNAPGAAFGGGPDRGRGR